jgi:serine/threonine-protein kinase RsbW
MFPSRPRPARLVALTRSDARSSSKRAPAAGADLDVSVPPLQFTGVGVPPSRLATLRHQLRSWTARTGLTGDQVDDLVLASHEAITNATEHAYSSGGGVVSLVASRTVDDQVVVVVRDRGRWRPAPADPGLRGRGLMLIKRLADHVMLRHDHDGTTVRMQWRVRPADAVGPGGETVR